MIKDDTHGGQSLERYLGENTIIDAGHYSLLSGPTELDVFLWKRGVELYSIARERGYKHIGLFLLVDDMYGVAEAAEERGISGNELRRELLYQKLPEAYSEVLERYNVEREEVMIVSQDRMREKSKQLLRRKEQTRQGRVCRRIVAATDYVKEHRGFTRAICLYDALKTEEGSKMYDGTFFGRAYFGTRLEVIYRIYQDVERYRDIYFKGSEIKKDIEGRNL